MRVVQAGSGTRRQQQQQHGGGSSGDEQLVTSAAAAADGFDYDMDDVDYDYDDDDEEETWDDAVADLGNPWDMRPARVGLMDDDEGFAPPRAATSAAAALAAAAAAEAAPQAGAQQAPAGGDASPSPFAAGPSGTPATTAAATTASSSTASGPSAAGGTAGVSPYAQPDAFERLHGAEELREFVSRIGSAGGRVVLLDVREDSEVAAAGGAAAGAGAAAAAAPPSPVAAGLLAAAGTVCAGSRGCEVVRVALSGLRAAQGRALGEAADYVVVLGPGDHRGEQAYVRLTRVHGLRRVLLLVPGGAE